jgi:hypothetical protein
MMREVSIARVAALPALGLLLALPGRPEAQESRPAAAPLAVTTGAASALGRTGATLDGTVNADGLPTTTWFEYGTDASYGFATPVAELPGRLGAYYRETWDEDGGGWETWLKSTHFASGGHAGGFIRYAEPSNDDRNHDDGIGTLHLVKALATDPFGKGSSLGGGDPDLRGARVSVWVRGNDFRPNGAELLWWTQAQSNIDSGFDGRGWRRANWAYTGFTLTDLALDGKWHRAEYRLLNDSTQWTYGGNNATLQGPSARRYEYWSIDQAQRHMNINFFHLLATVDRENRPTGSLDFDDFELVYRNRSLLFPPNGGRLIGRPRDPGERPDSLTDGWRHGPGHAWRSAGNPTEPLDFVWALENTVAIETVQIHQNPEWPSKQVAVSASTDGKTFTPVADLELPEHGVPNANFAFAVRRDLNARARYVRVTVRSGYRPEHWGLGEVEVFGSGAALPTERELTHVNADVANLTPGRMYHYRLVARTSRGTFHGRDAVFTPPQSEAPLVATGPARRVAAGEARVTGRLNPLGQRTQFHFEYGPDASYGRRSAAAYGGLLNTGRTVFVTLTGLEPGRTYHYRLVAVSAAGTSTGKDALLTTPAR